MPAPVTHTCRACGREIDPLRAGEVAFIDGRFNYFCDREHKAQWLASMRTSSSEVVTAEPPTVTTDVTLDASASFEDEPRSMSIRRWALSEEAPISMRTDATTGARDRSATPSPLRWMLAIGYVGVIVGALAIGVALLGPSSDVARIPLASAAFACASVYGWVAARRLVTTGLLWVSAAAMAMTLICTLWAWGAGAPFASLASLAGISAASFIALCAALMRASEPLSSARASILASLDVVARTRDGAVPAAEARAGELVSVGPGETVPVDGVVSSGEAVVSPWLDATTDVTKREGSPIIAGARVLSGSVQIIATWTGADRAFVKLLTAPNGGPFSTAPLVTLALRLDRRAVLPFCGVVGGVAFANGASVLDSIACAAAALGAFGTPVASFVVALVHARGHIRALQNGIVHRDARHFDRAGRARVAVVCARGTVLLGEPEIVAVEAIGGEDASRVIALAGAVVTGSAHPFAAAIVRAARARGARFETVRNAVHTGSGATAIDAQGERIVVGRRVFLLAEKVSIAVADALVREHEAQGRSVLLLARGGKVVGVVALQDGLRAGARAAIQKLHDARIEPVLLSGEARETCEAIGRALDIEHLRPEVAGPDRGTEVRALAEGGDIVAVLGHPAADDSALAAADVSVALDTAGASPGEWAVALASDDVRAAAEAMTIPAAVRERSIRAMVAAFAPGIVASLVLAFQLMPLWPAPLVSVIAASFTLLYAKE